MAPDTALIDSGADVSAFPLAWVLRLRIDTATLFAEQAQHVAGPIEVLRVNRAVTARIVGLEGNRFDLLPLFVDGLRTALLGRTDFMAYWDVEIDEPRQAWKLIRRSPNSSSTSD